MPIKIVNKRASLKKIEQENPSACIIDVTSNSETEFVKFSPFYPHGNIPVPFSPGMFSQSVEGIWQGLKVFETEDIDISKFNIVTMKNIKRSVRKNGRVIGHRKGVGGAELLDYYEARINIYLPSYKYALMFNLKDLVNKIKELCNEKLVVLLDYETNTDVKNIAKPLSHAGLIREFIEDSLP